MSKIWIKTISISQIVGGVCGIILTFYLLFISPLNILSFLIFPILFLINSLCLIAGILLWRKHRFGRKLSIITQFIQLPKIVSPLLTFTFSFGIDIYPYFQLFNNLSNVGIDIKILTFYQFFINAKDAPIGFGISLVSILFLIILFRYDPSEPESIQSEKFLPPTPEEYPDVSGKVEF